MGDAQSRRKLTSTHEWVHKWHHEWTHECAHEIAHESAHDRTHEGWFLCFQPFKDSHERSHETSMEVPTKVSSQVVEVHLFCFHLFCSSAIWFSEFRARIVLSLSLYLSETSLRFGPREGKSVRLRFTILLRSVLDCEWQDFFFLSLLASPYPF